MASGFHQPAREYLIHSAAPPRFSRPERPRQTFGSAVYSAVHAVIGFFVGILYTVVEFAASIVMAVATPFLLFLPLFLLFPFLMLVGLIIAALGGFFGGPPPG